LVRVLGVATCCAACGSSGTTRTYRQPSPSMLPTLKTGQRVTVSVDSQYAPKVGDIIAFHPPAGAIAAIAVCGNKGQGIGHKQACDTPTPKRSEQTFIKRVVAAPGDTITIINGHVYRNGKRENDFTYTLACGGGPACSYPSPITVPPQHYFVLGDNRGASDDSRFWGPVPRGWIIGKVRSP